MYLQPISFNFGFCICVNDARRRQFDAFRVISRLGTRSHWIRHTQKPLYTKFHDFHINPTSTSQFSHFFPDYESDMVLLPAL